MWRQYAQWLRCEARIWISSTSAGSSPSRAAASKPMRARKTFGADFAKSRRAVSKFSQFIMTPTCAVLKERPLRYASISLILSAETDVLLSADSFSLSTSTRCALLMLVESNAGNDPLPWFVCTSNLVEEVIGTVTVVAVVGALAAEVASRNITVNCVAPGFIATAMTDALNDEQKKGILSRVPAGRLGDSKDVAAAVVYLASEEAAYVTGQTLHVNGGMAMI